MKKIILASNSFSRKSQLERLCIPFITSSHDVDENMEKLKIADHEELSQKLSRMKARSVYSNNPNAIVIGGDTITSFDGRIISKPKTREKAIKQLTELNGNKHRVITSLTIIADETEYLHTEIAHMSMRKLSLDQINRYIEIDEPLESCGSCRLDSLGISLFDEIVCDDYTAIIGIPLIWTVKILSEIGVPVP